MDGWKMNFLLGRPMFRGYVSFREDIPMNHIKKVSPNKKHPFVSSPQTE